MSAIVVDMSAFAAIFNKEPTSGVVERVLISATNVIVPSTCLVEAALLARMAKGFHGWVERMIDVRGFRLAEISIPVAQIATNAARRYGKASGHPAGLNFGDCLSYAVAKDRDLPLLFVGEDFRHTDVRPALPQE